LIPTFCSRGLFTFDLVYFYISPLHLLPHLWVHYSTRLWFTVANTLFSAAPHSYRRYRTVCTHWLVCLVYRLPRAIYLPGLLPFAGLLPPHTFDRDLYYPHYGSPRFPLRFHFVRTVHRSGLHSAFAAHAYLTRAHYYGCLHYRWFPVLPPFGSILRFDTVCLRILPFGSFTCRLRIFVPRSRCHYYRVPLPHTLAAVWYVCVRLRFTRLPLVPCRSILFYYCVWFNTRIPARGVYVWFTRHARCRLVLPGSAFGFTAFPVCRLGHCGSTHGCRTGLVLWIPGLVSHPPVVLV